MGTRLEDDALADTFVRGTAVTGRRERTLRRDPLATVLSLLAGLHSREVGARRPCARSTALPFGRLPDGWHALATDVPNGHLVIGPAGAFTLHSKDLMGKVWIGKRSIRHNGHPTDFLSKASLDAARASSTLTIAIGRPVDVGAVIVILADAWTVTETPPDVHIGSPRSVRDWLVRLPAAWSSRDVSEIAAAAGRPSTWTPRP